MRLQITSAILLCLSVSLIQAQQTFSITAEVRDTENKLVPAGDVFLLLSEDSSLVHKGNIAQGVFKFNHVPNGNYKIRIVSLGYHNKLQEVKVGDNIVMQIKMEAAATVLKEVTVSATKPPFVYKNGNIVANMDSPLFSSVPDPVNLLSKIPSVQVSPDGETISVVGKGQPVIYINNIRASVNDVKSLSTADIKHIELINNPSARYEAEGRVVLLIRTRSNGKEGLKADLSQTAAFRKYYLNRASANVSYRKKKLELKGNIQFNHLKTWEGNAFDFNIPSRNISTGYSVTAVTSRLPQMIAGGGIFYQLNELDYVSVNANLRKVTERFPIYTDSHLQDNLDDENVTTANFNEGPEAYYNANLNYNKAFKKANATVFTGLQYTRLDEAVNSTIFNTFDNDDPQKTQDRLRISSISAVAGRIDFEKKFKAENKWETGLSISSAKSAGSADIKSIDAAGNIYSVYNYREYNGAAYAQLSGKYKKTTWSAGLRTESTDVTGRYSENGTSSAIDKKSINLFPKMSITFSPDSLKSATLRYSKNITRPGYSNANQTVVYINPYFEWANNIDLDPSLFQEIAATLQYRNYSFTASYFADKGQANSSFIYDAQRGVLRRTEINFDRESGIFVGSTIPFKYKLWSSTNVMNFIYSSIKDSSALKGKSRPFVYVSTSNEFSLPHQFVFTTSAWAVTKSYRGVFERNALFAVDTSLSKKFNKFTCTLRVDDMFASVNAKESFSVNDVAANGIFYDNSREFSLSLKYTFGKLKESTFKSRDVDENSRRVQ